MCPEGRGTFMELTVEENMRLGAYTRPARETTDDFEHMFGYFPRLKERYKQQAGTLSGGEQQMLAIARALLLRPAAAAAGRAVLRPRAADRAGDLPDSRLASSRMPASASCWSSRTPAIALEFAEDAYVLETGRIVMAGSSAEISKDEGIRRSYLGY